MGHFLARFLTRSLAPFFGAMFGALFGALSGAIFWFREWSGRFPSPRSALTEAFVLVDSCVKQRNTVQRMRPSAAFQVLMPSSHH